MTQYLLDFIKVCFGSNSSKPLSKGIRTLAIIFAITLTIAILLARSLARIAPDIGLLSTATIILIYSLASFLLVGIILLAYGTAYTKPSITKILYNTPIQLWKLWLIEHAVKILNTMLIATILSLQTISSFWADSHMLTISTIFIISISACASLGYLVGISKQWLRVASVICISAIGIKLLGLSIARPNYAIVEIGLAILIITGGLLLMQRSYKNFESTFQKNTSSPAKQIWLGKKNWLFSKILRNPRTIQSFTFCALVSLAVSALLLIGKLPRNDIFIIYLPAILVSSFAVDLRSISRIQKTPEIINLQGPANFIAEEWKSIMLIGVLISLPLLIHTSLMGIPKLAILIFGMGTLGLLIGHAIISGPNDPGSQLLSILVAISFDIASLKFQNIMDSNYLIILYWLTVGIMCYLLIILIERRRMDNYGQFR